MNEQDLLTLASQQGIDPSTLLHEEREVRFLAGIAEDPVLALHLAFKGGTALRLVYLCDRYSDDLDFDLVRQEVDPAEIRSRLEDVARRTAAGAGDHRQLGEAPDGASRGEGRRVETQTEDRGVLPPAHQSGDDPGA